MPHPPNDPSILARWIVAAPAWDAFVQAVRARPQRTRMDLKDSSEAGRTVVVAGNAIHVGRERVDLAHFHIHEVVAHDGWLQLYELDPDYLPCPLPLPTDDPALAAWLIGHFRAIAAQHAVESARRAEQYAIEASRPTLSNRVRWFVERHFIACLLGFFFVVLPLAAVLAAWVVGE